MRKVAIKISRGFSKWQVQLIFFIIPFIMGFTAYTVYYTCTETPAAFFRPFFSTVKMFGMVMEVTAPNPNYPVPEWVYTCLAITRYLAMVFSANIILRLIYAFFGKLFQQAEYDFWRTRNNCFLIVGNNAQTRDIGMAAAEEDRCMILCGTGEETAELKSSGLRFYATENPQKEVLRLVEDAMKRKNQKLTVIINEQDEEKNLSLCKAVVDCVKKATEADLRRHGELEKRIRKNSDNAEREKREVLEIEGRITGLLRRVKITVLGARKYEALYQEMQQESLNLLRYTNIYQMIGLDFVSEHPLTEYLTGEKERLLDSGGCVSPDADFNVIFIGFGDVSQEIFLNSFATNQFIENRENGIPGLKQVKYHIFDRVDARQDKNLRHSVFRYCWSFLSEIGKGELREADYLPLPEVPADMHFYVTDLSNSSFYDHIYDICAENPNSINQVIISYSSDLDNLDLAQRLAARMAERKMENLHLYVRVRNHRNKEVTDVLSGRDYDVFGDTSALYVPEKILQNEMEKMAYDRSLSYEVGNLEKARKKGGISDETIEIRALYKWHTMEQDKRLSNIYGILSMRMKLHLMKLDYVRNAAGNHVDRVSSNRDYMILYAKGEPPMETVTAGQKREYIFSNALCEPEDFTKNILRRNLAIQEHYRWNAYMIMCGFVPATIQQMEAGETKNYRHRYHANLTTFEGLFEYRKKMAEVRGTSEAQEDVICWDYQLMDSAWTILTDIGYEVVKR